MIRIGILTETVKHRDITIADQKNQIVALGLEIDKQNQAVLVLNNVINARQHDLDMTSRLANSLQKKYSDQAKELINSKQSLDITVSDYTSCQNQLKSIKDYMVGFENTFQEEASH